MKATAVRMKLHSGYKYAPDGQRIESAAPNLQDLSSANVSGEIAGAGRRLGARRLELLQYLADGKNLYDAAELMGVTRNTVRNYAAQIKEILDAETSTHAVVTALRNGWIT